MGLQVLRGSLPRSWDVNNLVVAVNAGSLIGTTTVTSAFGLVYWWFAARQFSPEAVGVASAALSAMMLLGSVSVLGLGTLLISELPRQPGREVSLIAGALLVTTTLGGGLGWLFAHVAASLSPDLEELAISTQNSALFASGVALTALTMVLDQALIGLLRGEIQLGRNAVFALAKLGALILAVVSALGSDGLTIYATWVAGNLVSVAGLAVLVASKGHCASTFRPQWRSLVTLARSAIKHHILNVALQAPSLALPIVVTVVLSATMNAYFYPTWMVAGFVFVGPVTLSTALYAVGTRAPAALADRMRFTLRLALLLALLANAVVWIAAGHILGVFGDEYASQGAWPLRIVGLGVFPLIVKDHYVAACRVHGRIARAALLVTVGSLLEIVLAAVGARANGISGLGLGWVLGVCLEAVLMGPPLYRLYACPAAVPEHGAEDANLADPL